MAESDHAKGLKLDQYFTRPALAQAVVEWAQIPKGAEVLEPSCGGGDLVRYMPEHCKVMAMDLDGDVFAKWGHVLQDRIDRGLVEPVGADFLRWRGARNAFDLVIMNPPYGWVGNGRARKAADRLHVQHALRIAPRVIVLARANFLWGQERYDHVMRFARLTRMAVLVHRPSFHGPALLPGQDSARHDFGVFEFQRCNDTLHPTEGFDRRLDRERVDVVDMGFWTQDWRLAA